MYSYACVSVCVSVCVWSIMGFYPYYATIYYVTMFSQLHHENFFNTNENEDIKIFHVALLS